VTSFNVSFIVGFPNSISQRFPHHFPRQYLTS
jgi:hypothetical protein